LRAKRLVDLTAAASALVLLSPILLLIALLIRVDSPGPVLFCQRRRGRHGRPFWIYKFRTMRPDAETLLCDLEARNEAARGVLFKMRHDPRVTRLGRFLRRTNLDELPQLINVLKGEMSLVGPRPFQERDCEKLDTIDPVSSARRLSFTPGLTGSWQVGRLNPTDSEHLLELDLYYLENWSLLLDLQIIYRTLFIVLAGFRNR
jgi:lipopolysaccharide/colanic/teichoic acid biosynthesis glycosyltransferase